MSVLNATVNLTLSSSCSSLGNRTAEKIAKIFAHCFVLVVSLAGNSFIGIIVYKTKTMRKTINYLIVNMAMSDLLFPIFVSPRVLTELHGSWLFSGPLGEALCKLHIIMPDISVVVSIQSLVLITVDRFGAVAFPLRLPLISSKLCPFFILATWTVAIALISPNFKALKLVQYPDKLECKWQWDEAFGESTPLETYVLALYVIFLYVPFVCMAIIYSIILFKLKSQKIPGEQSANAVQQRQKRERNVLKMAIAIVLGFAICWLPFSIIALINFFAGENSTRLACGFTRFGYIARFMSRANCAVNPCICFVFSRNFRQGLKKLLNRA